MQIRRPGELDEEIGIGDCGRDLLPIRLSLALDFASALTSHTRWRPTSVRRCGEFAGMSANRRSLRQSSGRLELKTATSSARPSHVSYASFPKAHGV